MEDIKTVKITNKENELLKLVLKFRYIKTNQLQKINKNKYSDTINERITKLKKQGLINTIKQTTFIEKTEHRIIYLTKAGRAYLRQKGEKNEKALNTAYKGDTVTKRFINYCSSIVDIYIYFLSILKKNEKLLFYSQNDLSLFDYFPDPLPAAYISIKTPKETRRYLLEYYDEFIPAGVLRFRIRKYLSYADSREWEENTEEELPSVLFICSTENKKRHIYHYAKDLLNKRMEDNPSIFLSTKFKVLNGGENNVNIWNKVE